jgi:hypothetical protein
MAGGCKVHVELWSQTLSSPLWIFPRYAGNKITKIDTIKF